VKEKHRTKRKLCLFRRCQRQPMFIKWPTGDKEVDAVPNEEKAFRKKAPHMKASSDWRNIIKF